VRNPTNELHRRPLEVGAIPRKAKLTAKRNETTKVVAIELSAERGGWPGALGELRRAERFLAAGVGRTAPRRDLHG
jgi:hypothetical protein